MPEVPGCGWCFLVSQGQRSSMEPPRRDRLKGLSVGLSMEAAQKCVPTVMFAELQHCCNPYSSRSIGRWSFVQWLGEAAMASCPKTSI